MSDGVFTTTGHQTKARKTWKCLCHGNPSFERTPMPWHGHWAPSPSVRAKIALQIGAHLTEGTLQIILLVCTACKTYCNTALAQIRDKLCQCYMLTQKLGLRILLATGWQTEVRFPIATFSFPHRVHTASGTHSLYSVVYKGQSSSVALKRQERIQPKSWRQYVPLKRWSLCTRPHGVTTHNTVLLKLTASDLTTNHLSGLRPALELEWQPLRLLPVFIHKLSIVQPSIVKTDT